MRKFRLNVFSIILHFGIFLFLVYFISSPALMIAFLFNKADNLKIIIPMYVISTCLTLFLSEIYFGYRPSRVIVAEKQVFMYSVLRKFEFDITDIQSIKLLKHVGSKDWGAEYCIVANVNGKRRSFYLHMQAITNLNDLISLLSHH